MAACDGHPHRPGRRADLRARLRHRRHGRASRCRRSTTSRPNLGQGYIIDSFMVVVFGGVGNLWGTLVGALTLGVANKFLEPLAGAVLGKICSWSSSSCSSRSGRAACSRSRAGRWKHDAHRALIASIAAAARRSWLAARGVAILVPVLNLALPPASPFHVPTYRGRAARQVSLLRAARRRARSGLGLLRHPLARPRRVLRARRLRDGHVPDAPDRDRAASTPTRSCRTSWCS